MAFNSHTGLDKKGFTIVELMIAISVLSVIMLVSSSAIIFLARQYQNGVTRTTLQSVSRQLHQKLNDSVKFSDKEIILMDNSGYSFICIGKSRYSFKTPPISIDNSAKINALSNLYYNVSDSDYTTANCANSFRASASKNLLPNNSKVAQATIDCDYSTSPKSCEIKTTFISGDGDLFNNDGTPANADTLKCKSGIGSQWCSVVNLRSTVNSKL